MKFGCKYCSGLIVLLAISVNANAAGSSVGVSIAKSYLYIDEVNVPESGDGTALILNGSLSLDKIFPINGFSIEGEYSKSRSPVNFELNDRTNIDKENFYVDTLIRKYDHQAFGGYLSYDFISAQDLIFRVRMGYVFSNGNDETFISCAGSCERRKEPVQFIGGISATPDYRSLTNGKGVSLGVNLSYLILRHLYGSLEFTRLKISYEGFDGEYGVTFIGAGIGLRM